MIAIFSKVKMNAKLIIGAVIFVIFATIGQMLAPAMVSVMLTDGVNNKNYGLITGMAIAIISLTILACIMNLISTKLASKITTRFCADLRKNSSTRYRPSRPRKLINSAPLRLSPVIQRM